MILIKSKDRKKEPFYISKKQALSKLNQFIEHIRGTEDPSYSSYHLLSELSKDTKEEQMDKLYYLFRYKTY
jgi:hypothetical protein